MFLIGPYDYDSGSCQTCGNSFVDCVGHMGHIKLCKPVYNRIFGRAIYSIMRMSCLHCFKLQLPGEFILKHTEKHPVNEITSYRRGSRNHSPSTETHGIGLRSGIARIGSNESVANVLIGRTGTKDRPV